MADAVGGDLKAVLGKGDEPAYHNDKKERFFFEFKVSIPGKRHKDIGDCQQYNRFHQ